MRTGAPLSLRRRLLLWLLVPLFVMAGGLVAEAYFSSKETADEIHDRMLLSLAWLASEHAVGNYGDMLPEAASDLISSSTNERVYYLVTGPDRAFLTGYGDLPGPPPGQVAQGGVPLFYDSRYNEEPVRMLLLRQLVEGRDINGWMEIRIAQTREARNAMVQDAVVRSALRVTVVIFLAAFLVVVGVNYGLAPLNSLQEAIRRRSYDDLSPISQQMPREVTRLVGALNELLDRLTDSIQSQRRFIANASHQLRTPLSVLQAEAELALREVDDPSGRAALEQIQRGTRKTSRLANQLLSLTRVRGRARTSGEEVDLSELAKEVTMDRVRHPLAKGRDMGFEGSDGPVPVQGSAVELQELIANLIDNALHYGGERITVRVVHKGRAAVLEVEDNGPGIPNEMRAEVFERFVRLDERQGEGCGLGLNIVREIAVGHGGRVALLDGPQGVGLLVRVSFA